jgi:diguanylate cyclase (GGDEF)-like protein
MTEASGSGNGPRVLVVDDNPTNVDLLVRRLERDGYCVFSLDNALTLEADVERIQPDVVLLDWMMPERNGIDALRGIRKMHDANRFPVIMVTARGEGDAVSEAIEAGANDYITKPIDFVVLRSRLNGVLVRRMGVLEVDQANEQLEAKVSQRTIELQSANSRLKGEVTERIKAEARANRLARTDILTGLPNRLHLMDRLRELANRNIADFEPFTLIQVNLDRFRTINNIHGPLIGDDVLRVVAQRLKDTADSSDLIARTAADEFLIILPVTVGDGVDLAQKIRKAIAEPICVEGRKLAISSSIAVARSGYPPCDPGAMMVECDTAMRVAQKESGGGICCYDEKLANEIREKMIIKRDLAEGIPKGEIVPFFQPIVDFKSGEVICAEVLARWQHPTRGMVSPADFIPAAEEGGMIDDLFWAILPVACEAAKRFSDTARIAVNVSPSQVLDQWFPQKVLKALAQTGFPAARLDIEMTETALFMDLKSTRTALRSLRAQGVGVVLDDFGVGFSSLSLLRELPITKVKVDCSFVAGILTDPSAAALVRGLLNLCDLLNVETTAEGIEEAAVAVQLAEWGCTYGQGYWLGRPGAELKLETPWKQQLKQRAA